MVQVPSQIIGMSSMLLLELSLFTNKVISYRPNYKKEFIGEKIRSYLLY